MSNAQRNECTELKVVPIGNSKGVRLPKGILKKYGFAKDLIAEERAEGLLLKPNRDRRISWEDTYREMAQEKESWADFDAISLDGLENE